MTKRLAMLNALRESNASTFMRQGPGLSRNYQTFVVARDRGANQVLIGGLGGMGCGEMWFPERLGHASLPGYDDAPEMEGQCDLLAFIPEKNP